MSQKIVFELSVYTDGDWGYDEALFRNYRSKYFDNDLYEYTVIRDYSLKIRRVFEVAENGFDKIIELLKSFSDSIHARSESEREYLTDFFTNQINNVDKHEEFYDCVDGNTEIDIQMSIVENNVECVKNIVFRDGTVLSFDD